MLPKAMGIPVFEKTNTEMTFFFQIEMLADHRWSGHTISVFASTDYVDDDSFLPKLPSPLAGADLSADFFNNYQTFFRIFIFKDEDAIRLDGYKETIAFRSLRFSDEKPVDTIEFGRIAERPKWILEDESPRSFDKQEGLFEFLFQTKSNYEFKTVDGADRQKVLDYSGSGQTLTDSEAPTYTLFASNELYFFGLSTPEKLIYIVPQS